MKKIVLTLIYLVGFIAFSQNNIIDVIIDNKPAKMNTATGIYTFTNGAPKSYNVKNKNIILDSAKVNLHKVCIGETLYSISKKYGISLAQIKSLNNLKSNILKVDQQIKIGYNTSAEIKSTNTYLVKKGDTLYRIAKAYNLTIKELKTLNNLESDNISIGQELTIK